MTLRRMSLGRGKRQLPMVGGVPGGRPDFLALEA